MSFIYKDSKGITWISSTQGVYLYDGSTLILCQPGNKWGKGILGKNIQSPFLEDSEGNIWFGTEKSINRYSRKEQAFSSFQLIDEKGDTLFGDHLPFYLQSDSLLWLKVEGQIYHYNTKN